jgi:hypothetical protein|tara:strand:- start:308 stop:547 length:240 start_codon:yes stop_codon:yes gene_type:complete
VLTQAIRDCVSVDYGTQSRAIEWFISEDFTDFCEEIGLDVYTLRESMLSLATTPSALLKKNAEDTISSLRASFWQKKTR